MRLSCTVSALTMQLVESSRRYAPQAAVGPDLVVVLPPDRVGASGLLQHLPLRFSSLRALGEHLNVYAIESFMDELAHAAGVDPVQFRLRHLKTSELAR